MSRSSFMAILSISITGLLAQPGVGQTIERRTLNNGQLILEDIPPIPDQMVEDLNRYQNIRSASLYGWDPSGKSLLISTRFGDVSQIHQVKKAAGARTQLSFFSEPIGQVEVRPNTSELAFTMDSGGNENAQIYLLDTKSGEYKLITDGRSRHQSLLWSQDSSLLAYQSTKRNGVANDIWLAQFNPRQNQPQHTLILEAPDGYSWSPQSFSSTGKSLLVSQYISSIESSVYLLDIESQKLRRMAGSSEQPSRNFPVGFTENDAGIFLLTDRYSQFTQLTYLDLKSGKETVLTKSIPWDISTARISNDKRTVALVSNEDGYSRLYKLDTKTFQLQIIDSLPDAVISSLEFNPDSKSLGLSMSTPTSPTDVYVLDWQSYAMERWTYSETGGLNTDEFLAPKLVKYPSFDQVDGKPRMIPAFYYLPETKGPHPVIISIHGGPESQSRPYFSSTYQMWIAKIGAAVLVPNVRGSAGYGKDYLALDNGYKREDSVKDIGALLDWVKKQPELDASRVAVYGGSYGGYMVLASAVHFSDRLKAAIDIVGISNFVTFLTNTKGYRRDLRRVEYGDERDPKMRQHLQSISPNQHVDKIKVPLFIVQGENDPRVPVSEASQMVKALRSQGQKVWYMNALNEGHGYRKKENRDIYQQAVLMFLDSQFRQNSSH